MDLLDKTMTYGAVKPEEARLVRLLVVFLLIDVVFIALYVARDFLLDTNYNIGFLQSELWMLETDRGFPEVYQYLKAAFAAALLWLGQTHYPHVE